VRNGGDAIAALDGAMVRPAWMGEEEFFEKVCPPLPGNEPEGDWCSAACFSVSRGGAGLPDFRRAADPEAVK
jgi:hypothetical protein